MGFVPDICSRQRQTFGLIAQSILTAGEREFLTQNALCRPIGFDASKYSRPEWQLSVLWAARDRVRYWAERAMRFAVTDADA